MRSKSWENPVFDPHFMVREFHETYKMPINDGRPATLTDERWRLRIDLIKEETKELLEGVTNQDIVEIADALGDLVYVVYGAAIECGIDLGPVLAEIQKSNMSKLAADGSVIYREDGKVLKGPNFVEPNLRSVLFNGNHLD